MRKKSPRQLTAAQKGTVRRLCILMGAAVLLWLLFAPGRGLFSLLRQRSALNELQQQTEKLQRENTELAKEIERLENDPAYLEEVARRDYGLLKKNEHVYDFSKTDKNEDEE